MTIPEKEALPSGRAGAHAERRRLFSTFGYLIGTQGATATLGLAYWPLSTHFFPAAVVGVAAAASSTAVLLGSLGVLGVATLVLAEIGAMSPSERRLTLTTGIAVSSLVVILLGLGTVALSPLLGKSLRTIGREPLLAALFVIGAVATVATATFDNAATGLRRGPVRLIRAVMASLVKLAVVGVLIVAGVITSSGLVLAWAAGLVISLTACSRMLRLDRGPAGRRGLRARMDLARRYGKLSLNHHVLNLSISSVSFILPVVAALLVLPQEVAYFSTAQVLSSTLLIVPYLLAFALFAETANDEALLRRDLRRTLPLSVAACILIIVGVELAAPVGLSIFGRQYASHGSTVLRLLVLGGLPYVVKDHYVAIKRAQRRLSQAAWVVGIGTVAETAAGALGGVLFGLDGLAAGWSIAATLEGMVLLPTVVSMFRSSPHGQQASMTMPQ